MRVKFENLVIDAAGMGYAIRLEEGPLDGELPVNDQKLHNYRSYKSRR